jgi:hypothetical protein
MLQSDQDEAPTQIAKPGTTGYWPLKMLQRLVFGVTSRSGAHSESSVAKSKWPAVGCKTMAASEEAEILGWRATLWMTEALKQPTPPCKGACRC